MTDHVLNSRVGTVHWGYFDAAEKPVLTIKSGDRVTMETISGAPDVMPPPSSASRFRRSCWRCTRRYRASCRGTC